MDGSGKEPLGPVESCPQGVVGQGGWEVISESKVFLSDACEVVCDGADRQPPDEGQVGAEQDKGLRLCGEAGEVEVTAETSEDSTLTRPVAVCPR